MAALVSSDWTIAVLDRRTENKVRVHRCSMTLATVGTYPSGGVPIPTTPSRWGFARNFDTMAILDSSQGSGKVVKFSATGYVIRFYQNPASASDTGTAQGDLAELATTATAGTSDGMVLYVHAFGW